VLVRADRHAAEAKVALAFTLSQPVTAAVSPSHAELLWLACDALDALGPPPWDAARESQIEGACIFQ